MDWRRKLCMDPWLHVFDTKMKRTRKTKSLWLGTATFGSSHIVTLAPANSKETWDWNQRWSGYGFPDWERERQRDAALEGKGVETSASFLRQIQRSRRRHRRHIRRSPLCLLLCLLSSSCFPASHPHLLFTYCPLLSLKFHAESLANWDFTHWYYHIWPLIHIFVTFCGP